MESLLVLLKEKFIWSPVGNANGGKSLCVGIAFKKLLQLEVVYQDWAGLLVISAVEEWLGDGGSEQNT